MSERDNLDDQIDPSADLAWCHARIKYLENKIELEKEWTDLDKNRIATRDKNTVTLVEHQLRLETENNELQYKLHKFQNLHPEVFSCPEPVGGDLLPPLGSTIWIHLASIESWVPHTVNGYYVWGDLDGNEFLHRVYVRVVDENGFKNARLLRDIKINQPESAAK